MRRNIPRWCLLVAALAPVLLASVPRDAAAQAPASAGDDAPGKVHFDKAVALFREGDHRAALVEFRRSYDLSHNYRVLYNVAQSEFEVHDYAGALKTFKKYLSEGGAEIDAARRAEVEADIQQLATRVATLAITSNASGADVLVDDVLVGRTPFSEPVLVSAGRRKITLQKGDAPTVSRVLDIVGGDTPSVTLNLAEPRPSTGAPAVTASSPAPAPAPPAPPSRAAFWVAFSGTALLAAGGAVAGGFAIDAYNQARATLATPGVSADDLRVARARTISISIAADVLGGAAIALGVVTILVGVTGGTSQSGAPKPSASLRVGPQGVSLTGSF